MHIIEKQTHKPSYTKVKVTRWYLGGTGLVLFEKRMYPANAIEGARTSYHILRIPQ